MSHNFDPVSTLSIQSKVSVELFHPSTEEQRACCMIGKDLPFYCLLKQAYHDKREDMLGMKNFVH